MDQHQLVIRICSLKKVHWSREMPKTCRAVDTLHLEVATALGVGQKTYTFSARHLKLTPSLWLNLDTREKLQLYRRDFIINFVETFTPLIKLFYLWDFCWQVFSSVIMRKAKHASRCRLRAHVITGTRPKSKWVEGVTSRMWSRKKTMSRKEEAEVMLFVDCWEHEISGK